MTRTLSAGLLLALLGVALLAGCGSSSSSSSTSGATGSTSSSSTATGTSSTSTASSSSAIASAVASCKRGVRSAGSLSSATKSKLEGICDKAGSGDEKAARNAAKEVCTEIVKASPLPNGTLKERALAACAAEAKS